MKLFTDNKKYRTIIITEEQAIMLHEATDGQFSTDELDAINDFRGKVEYCIQHLGNYIAAGSSRAVFQIDDEKVLKLGYNEAGRAQNIEEMQWSNGQYSFLPQVYDSANNGDWMISEYVLPAEEADFTYYFEKHLPDECRKLVSTWGEFTEFIHSVEAKVKNHAWRFFSDAKLNLLRTDPLFNEVADYIEKTKMSTGDLTVLNNWGLAKRNNDAMPVLLDAGWRNGMNNEFYRGAGPQHIDDILR